MSIAVMRPFYLALVLTTLACPFAGAQESADLTACKSSSGQQQKPDNKTYAAHIRETVEQVNIPACSRVIADKSAPKENRLTAYHRRANYFAYLGRFDKARADVSDLMKLDPKRAETHVLRAALLRRQKRPLDAMASLTQSIAALPKQPSLLIERGRLHETFKEFDEAQEDYSKAIKIADDPVEIAEARMARGRIYSRTGKFKEAIEDYSVAIENEKRPDEIGFAYVNRAEAWLYLKEREKSEADIGKTREVTAEGHPARALANMLQENIERQRRREAEEKDKK